MVPPVVSVDDQPVSADEVLLTPRLDALFFPNLPLTLRLRSREPLAHLDRPSSCKYLHRVNFIGRMSGSPLEAQYMGRHVLDPSPARPWPLFEYEYVCALQR